MELLETLIVEGTVEGAFEVTVRRCSCRRFWWSGTVTNTYKAKRIVLENHSVRIFYDGEPVCSHIIPLDTVIDIKIC